MNTRKRKHADLVSNALRLLHKDDKPTVVESHKVVPGEAS